jgi:hypothetical protein
VDFLSVIDVLGLSTIRPSVSLRMYDSTMHACRKTQHPAAPNNTELGPGICPKSPKSTRILVIIFGYSLSPFGRGATNF